jgi:hypothetical protein
VDNRCRKEHILQETEDYKEKRDLQNTKIFGRDFFNAQALIHDIFIRLSWRTEGLESIYGL